MKLIEAAAACLVLLSGALGKPASLGLRSSKGPKDAVILAALAQEEEEHSKVLKQNKTSANQTTVKNGIAPELNPESDKKFFHADYPDDHRPAIHKMHFGHPYPEVEDDSHYDRDYVDDKNGDGGEWKAQSEYDRLKNLLAKEYRELQEALAKAQKEKEEADAARKAEAIAEKKANEEESERQIAAADENGNATRVKSLDEKIEDATKMVEQELADLEKCKAELATAKAALKSLLDEKELAEKKENEAERIEELEKHEEETAEETEAELEKRLAKEEADHAAALKVVAKEEQDVKDAEDKLAKAAKVLSKYRYNDPDEGTYSTMGGKKAGAAGMRLHAALLVLLAALAYLAW